MYFSTKSPLNAGATWTSQSKNPGNADTIVGGAKTDQTGVLRVQQSFDGTNWDLTEDIAVAANTGVSFSRNIYAPYIRLQFENTAGTNQTYLRLYAKTASAGYRG